jgi:hypothetical protein
MDVEKTVSMDVARWTAQLPAPALSIILKSPVPIWVGSPQNPQIGRGSIAVPAYVNFSAVEPDVQQESTTAVYTYVPGEVVESNAWPMWQH